ncbi:MAG TPA: hypothetical protein VGB18_09395 [Candidatus Thermoplasmatota archaeon]
MFRLAWLALVLCALLPSAEAQPSSDPPVAVVAEPDASLPNGRLVPETGQARVRILVDVGCALPPHVGESEVTFKVDTTVGYASVILSPGSTKFEIPPEACTNPDYRHTVETSAIVTTTRQAPALQSFASTVSATIQAESARYGPYPVSFELVNEFLPLTLLNPHQLYQKAAPGKTIVFPVEAQNLGNGPVRVTVEATQPNKNKLDVVDPGPVIHLESRTGRGAQAQFKKIQEIRVETPPSTGYVNAIYQFNVKYSSVYDGNATGALATDEQTISLAVQVQGGLGGAAPGVASGGILLALSAALLLRRRAP